jgi:hypothetical protein
MRSPLSRSQTPTAPRRAVGFFRSGRAPGHPGSRTERRSSTSATNSIREHDRRSSDPRASSTVSVALGPEEHGRGHGPGWGQHQPRFTGQVRERPKPRPRIPARSARTPLVAGPWPRWSETPAPRRSHLDGAALERAAPRALRVSLARTTPGPRAASPVLPRRRAGFAEPEVPSTGEPDRFQGALARPPGNRCDAAETPSFSSPSRASLLGVRSSPQDVANLWKTHDAFLQSPGAAALDGAADTESTGDATKA